MQVVKGPPASARDVRDAGSIPGLGRSPGEGPGDPLQCSCLENFTDRGAWRATVPGAAKSQTRLHEPICPVLDIRFSLCFTTSCCTHSSANTTVWISQFIPSLPQFHHWRVFKRENDLVYFNPSKDHSSWGQKQTGKLCSGDIKGAGKPHNCSDKRYGNLMSITVTLDGPLPLFVAFQWIISNEVPLLFSQREQKPYQKGSDTWWALGWDNLSLSRHLEGESACRIQEPVTQNHWYDHGNRSASQLVVSPLIQMNGTCTYFLGTKCAPRVNDEQKHAI